MEMKYEKRIHEIQSIIKKFFRLKLIVNRILSRMKNILNNYCIKFSDGFLIFFYYIYKNIEELDFMIKNYLIFYSLEFNIFSDFKNNYIDVKNVLNNNIKRVLALNLKKEVHFQVRLDDDVFFKENFFVFNQNIFNLIYSIVKICSDKEVSNFFITLLKKHNNKFLIRIKFFQEENIIKKLNDLFSFKLVRHYFIKNRGIFKMKWSEIRKCFIISLYL